MKRDYPALLQPAPARAAPSMLVKRLLRIVARCVRVAAKARAGGYGARVPAAHLAWLERHAAKKAAR